MRSTIRFTSPLDGLKSGSGAPLQISTRTSIRSASSASRLRMIAGSSPRVSSSSGEKYHPARWTCDSARASSSATLGRNVAPSISTSTLFPDRCGNAPRAHSSDRRLERVRPADLAEATGVMSYDRTIDRASESVARRVGHLAPGCRRHVQILRPSCVAPGRHGATRSGLRATLSPMAETTMSLDQRLEEIGAQLAWVRDYL